MPLLIITMTRDVSGITDQVSSLGAISVWHCKHSFVQQEKYLLTPTASRLTLINFRDCHGLTPTRFTYKIISPKISEPFSHVNRQKEHSVIIQLLQSFI